MSKEQVQERINFFIEKDMIATFRDRAVFDEVIKNNRSLQESGAPFKIPAGLPAATKYTQGVTPNGTRFVSAEPAVASNLSDITVVYYHGGGFLFDLGFAHLNLASHLANALNCRVILPLYTCLPSASYKEIYAQSMDAYKYARSIAPQNRIVFMGDSAGGNICIAVSQLAAGEGYMQPSLIIPYSPFIDLYGSAENRLGIHVEGDPLIDWRGSRWIADLFAGGVYAPSFPPDPYFGPKEGLAPMVVISGSLEVLAAGTREFASQLEAAGVDVRYYEAEGLWHAFLLDVGQGIEEVEECFSMVVDAIKSCTK